MGRYREMIMLNEDFAKEFDPEARVVSASLVNEILEELEAAQDDCMDLWFKAYICKK